MQSEDEQYSARERLISDILVILSARILEVRQLLSLNSNSF